MPKVSFFISLVLFVVVVCFLGIWNRTEEFKNRAKVFATGMKEKMASLQKESDETKSKVRRAGSVSSLSLSLPLLCSALYGVIRGRLPTARTV